MPYLHKTIKRALQRGSINASEPGHLNFIFTEICKHYLEFKGERYSTYNDIVGALECCKLELYRRKAALYEDVKISENGDVY